MGNDEYSKEGNNDAIKVKYGIDPSKIKEIEGQYYLDLERDQYKLNREILYYFEKENDFSKEKELDLPQIKNN